MNIAKRVSRLTGLVEYPEDLIDQSDSNLNQFLNGKDLFFEIDTIIVNNDYQFEEKKEEIESLVKFYNKSFNQPRYNITATVRYELADRSLTIKFEDLSHPYKTAVSAVIEDLLKYKIADYDVVSSVFIKEGKTLKVSPDFPPKDA